MVIELCDFGTGVRGCTMIPLPRIRQVSTPTEDFLVRVSGSVAVELRGGMQLLFSHGPVPPSLEGFLDFHSQILLAPVLLDSVL